MSEAVAVRGERAAAAELLNLLRLEQERALCLSHPAYLLDFVVAVDADEGDRFVFDLLSDDERALVGRPSQSPGWRWQREVLDMWLANPMSVILKGRQLGITWLAAGLGLWIVVTKPGTKVLCVSTNESEAAKVVNRLWDMFLSLPEHLRMGVRVLKPSRGARPFTEVEFAHPDGRVSRVLGLPSTPKAGHGERAALVILDEFSRHDYAQETWKAVFPTAEAGGRLAIVSTANGVSNETTGEGNFFHNRWAQADGAGITRRFLRWSLHPDRDEGWYRRVALALPAKDRAEQYPNDEFEAFILTGDLHFDAEALAWYAANGVRGPVERFMFEPVSARKARRAPGDRKPIRLFEQPKPDGRYAVAADVATGRGRDFSAAYVVDLQTAELCAELHGRMGADQLGYQLHYLGRMFNTAKVAVEMGGGYGEPVIMTLRDGTAGRPPYPNLYRHTMRDRPEFQETKPYGFPMNTKTRPQVLNQAERWIRERHLPYMTGGLLSECQTFVNQPTNPSPRAQEGCNDDRVLALAIGLEMFRQYGSHPEMRRRHRPRRRRPKPAYPWQKAA